MNEPDTPRRPEPPPEDAALVPTWDVRNCIVCGQPMQQLKCKYVCRVCGTKIDCSDPF